MPHKSACAAEVKDGSQYSHVYRTTNHDGKTRTRKKKTDKLLSNEVFEEAKLNDNSTRTQNENLSFCVFMAVAIF